MKSFDYARPESIGEAISMLDSGSTRLLAGGTDLLTLMKLGISTPERLVDIKRLPELDDAITDTPDGATIGALASLSEIETHPLITALYPALAEAAAIAATPQLRNMATIGGNLLQRPRCWYYRSPEVTCWLEGGDTCYARDGQNQYHALFDVSSCVAVHPSDLATALLALGASVTVRGVDGDHTIPLEAFFAPPEDRRRTETTLGVDEIVVSVHLPQADGRGKSAYLKAMERKVWAFALVSAGAWVTVEDGIVRDARLALGGVAPVPWLVSEVAELLVGQAPGEEAFERVAEAALAGATPLEHNGYKVPLLKSLITRALAQVTGV